MRWLLLLGLGLIVLAVVGALVFGRLTGAADPTPAVGQDDDALSARQALAPAAEWAAQWKEDARLAVVSSRRSAVGKQLGGEIEWTFQFFSPSTQRLALVTVTGETAQPVRESLSPYSVATFSVEDWRVDSDQALQAWWNQGGGSMVARRPDTDLAMQLRVSGEQGDAPVWTVVGTIEGTEVAFAVLVNATTGEPVEQ